MYNVKNIHIYIYIYIYIVKNKTIWRIRLTSFARGLVSLKQK